MEREMGSHTAEYTAQQRAALAVLLLLTQGPQRAVELGHRLGYSDDDAWRLLDNLSGVHELGLSNDRGWWSVQSRDLQALSDALRIVEQSLCETEGAAYCRPLSRRDMGRIRIALKQIRTMVVLPDVP